MTPGWARAVHRLVLLLCILSSPAGSASGQEDERGFYGGWSVRAEAQADLWFYGLARVGHRGFSRLPLYSDAYVARVRSAKQAAGVETPLDARALEFGRAFTEDSAFEVLHFVPLYFAGAAVEELLATLRAVAEGVAPERAARRPALRFGAAVMAALVEDGDARRVLEDYLAALEAEWNDFFADFWNATAVERRGRVTRVRERWQRSLSVAIDGFLRRYALEGGVVLVSEPLGPEGRIFRGAPDNASDNVVAVWLPPGPRGPEVSALSIVREACYPLVSGLVEQSGLTGRDRFAGERMSGVGAVRCGAMLLEDRAPAFAPAYRRAFLAAAGDTSDEASFRIVYSLDTALRTAIARALASY